VSKKQSLVVVLAALTFLIFLVLTARDVIGARGSLHGHSVSGGRWSERIINRRRLGKRKLIEVVDAHVLILAALVAEDHILALADVMALRKYILERPQDATGGGGRGSRWCGSSAGVSVARSSWSGRNTHRDDWSCQKLRLEIGHLMVLHEINLYHLLDHHHDWWGVPTAVKSGLRNVDDLL
jgi:hypothetical protein